MYFIGTLTKFFVWWYSEGLVRLFKYQGAFLTYLANMFSVGESVRHLFAPWKRLVGPRRPGLEGIRDWLLDNMVSRGIGFMMRVFLIAIFIVGFILWATTSLIFTVFWLAWPILIPLGFIWGLTNV